MDTGGDSPFTRGESLPDLLFYDRRSVPALCLSVALINKSETGS